VVRPAGVANYRLAAKDSVATLSKRARSPVGRCKQVVGAPTVRACHDAGFVAAVSVRECFSRYPRDFSANLVMFRPVLLGEKRIQLCRRGQADRAPSDHCTVQFTAHPQPGVRPTVATAIGGHNSPRAPSQLTARVVRYLRVHDEACASAVMVASHARLPSRRWLPAGIRRYRLAGRHLLACTGTTSRR
jgi:hypothetical protein